MTTQKNKEKMGITFNDGCFGDPYHGHDPSLGTGPHGNDRVHGFYRGIPGRGSWSDRGGWTSPFVKISPGTSLSRGNGPALWTWTHTTWTLCRGGYPGESWSGSCTSRRWPLWTAWSGISQWRGSRLRWRSRRRLRLPPPGRLRCWRRFCCGPWSLRIRLHSRLAPRTRIRGRWWTDSRRSWPVAGGCRCHRRSGRPGPDPVGLLAGGRRPGWDGHWG